MQTSRNQKQAHIMADTTTQPQNTYKEHTRLPETVTIGEQTFIVKDTPELVSLISRVAQIEKSKLYSQIESLKENMAKLENVQVEPSDLSGLKDQLMTAMTERIKEIIQPLIEKTQKIETNSIEDYRNKLISDNATICIPEMVQGKTKEELDAALQSSIEVRKRFPTANPIVKPAGASPVVDPVIKQAMDEANASQNNLVNNNAAPISSNQTTKSTAVPNIPVGEPTKTDIGRLSNEEFKARREELKRQISSLV